MLAQRSRSPSPFSGRSLKRALDEIESSPPDRGRKRYRQEYILRISKKRNRESEEGDISKRKKKSAEWTSPRIVDMDSGDVLPEEKDLPTALIPMTRTRPAFIIPKMKVNKTVYVPPYPYDRTDKQMPLVLYKDPKTSLQNEQDDEEEVFVEPIFDGPRFVELDDDGDEVLLPSDTLDQGNSQVIEQDDGDADVMDID